MLEQGPGSHQIESLGIRFVLPIHDTGTIFHQGNILLSDHRSLGHHPPGLVEPSMEGKTLRGDEEVDEEILVVDREAGVDGQTVFVEIF